MARRTAAPAGWQRVGTPGAEVMVVTMDPVTTAAATTGAVTMEEASTAVVVPAAEMAVVVEVVATAEADRDSTKW